MLFPKTLLHSLDPELIHDLTVAFSAQIENLPGLLKLINAFFNFEDTRLNISIGNLDFPNPIGLAAGFDKDGVAVSVLQALGFGHIETGTVTPKPQPGNSKPRLFRLSDDQGIINRMGFNNKGIDALVNSLIKVKRRVPIGINLGKNKQTPLDEAHNDYVQGLSQAWNSADYFTINISSPNTKDLRSLQNEDFLVPLLEKIMAAKTRLTDESKKERQVWLKIAPDLNQNEIEVIVQIALELKIDALIVSNTTISRPELVSKEQMQTGGLSGKPLLKLSNEVLKSVNNCAQGRIPLIGVGGIFNGQDIFEKLSLGASMVQVYTGLIYKGPGIVKRLKSELCEILTKNKVNRLSDFRTG